MMQKQQQYEENTTRLYPTNRSQNIFKNNQGIISKTSSYLNKTAWAQNIASFDKTNTNKNLLERYHPYTMKIALITKILEKKQYHPKS